MSHRKNFLKERRRASGLSQKELAERVDLTLTTISRYENGSRGMDRSTIGKIADVLGVEGYKLFIRPEEETCNPSIS